MPVSLGVDAAASNEAADMQNETHAAWLLQQARKGMLAQPPTLAVPLKAVLAAATGGGCGCAGEAPGSAHPRRHECGTHPGDRDAGGS